MLQNDRQWKVWLHAILFDLNSSRIFENIDELKSDHDALQIKNQEFYVKITKDMEEMMKKFESNFSLVYEKTYYFDSVLLI